MPPTNLFSLHGCVHVVSYYLCCFFPQLYQKSSRKGKNSALTRESPLHNGRCGPKDVIFLIMAYNGISWNDNFQISYQTAII